MFQAPASDLGCNGRCQFRVGGTSWSSLQQLCKECLEPLRAFANQPIIISSSYRCSQLNIKVGGAYASQHTLGEAADIYTISPRPLTLIGQTTKPTLIRNLPNAGSYGSNPTQITISSLWKPPMVATSGSMSLAVRTSRRTAIR